MANAVHSFQVEDVPDARNQNESWRSRQGLMAIAVMTLIGTLTWATPSMPVPSSLRGAVHPVSRAHLITGAGAVNAAKLDEHECGALAGHDWCPSRTMCIRWFDPCPGGTNYCQQFCSSPTPMVANHSCVCGRNGRVISEARPATAKSNDNDYSDNLPGDVTWWDWNVGDLSGTSTMDFGHAATNFHHVNGTVHRPANFHHVNGTEHRPANFHHVNGTEHHFANFHHVNGTEHRPANFHHVNNGTDFHVLADREDEHGCLLGAGYSWCPSRRMCIRAWLQSCPEGTHFCQEYCYNRTSIAGSMQVTCKCNDDGVALDYAPEVADGEVHYSPNDTPFPASWGAPPTMQTKDLRELPDGYGMGSTTLATWIQAHLDSEDADDRMDKRYKVMPWPVTTW